MNTATIDWTFNGNYRDHDQVAQFMPAFLERLMELELAHQFAYDADFRGHLGITNERAEMTAVYICRNKVELDRLASKVAGALEDGFTEVEIPAAGEQVRYETLVCYGFYMGGTGWAEVHNVRLLNHHGSPAYMTKGARTQAHLLMGGKMLGKQA